MKQNSKKGILVVSFGTSHLDTLDKTIGAIERRIQQQYPQEILYRGFTSGMILAKLKKKEQLPMMNVSEALEKMHEDGIETVSIQPTHIIHGVENDKMVEQIKAKSHLFKKIVIGNPLLSSVEDYKAAIHAVMETIALEEEEGLVFMGHGTDHYANAAYPALEYTAHTLGYDRVLVGTVEGFPQLKHVMTGLETRNIRKVKLMPFMVVAGDHAKNDMAGEEDSWKTILEKAGYQVEVILKGLGEMKGIQNLFVEHLREAKEQ
ncbi:MAG: sirohydrochlorin cobaltochelatase [Lachnospiraceae bacterium]